MKWFRQEIASHFAQEGPSFGPRPSLEALKALEEAVIAQINYQRKARGAAPLVSDTRFDRWMKTEGRNRAVTGRYGERDERTDASLARYGVRWQWILRSWKELTCTGDSAREIERFVSSWAHRRKKLLSGEFQYIAASAQITRTGQVFLFVAILY